MSNQFSSPAFILSAIDLGLIVGLAAYQYKLNKLMQQQINHLNERLSTLPANFAQVNNSTDYKIRKLERKIEAKMAKLNKTIKHISLFTDLGELANLKVPETAKEEDLIDIPIEKKFDIDSEEMSVDDLAAMLSYTGEECDEKTVEEIPNEEPEN